MRRILQHVSPLDERELMAGHELGLFNQVRRLDRMRAETQVRHRHRAGLLRVIDEVALRIVVGALGDDLDRVLVGADGAVRTQTEEHRPLHTFELGVERGIRRQREMGDVVGDADGELRLRLVLLEFIEDSLGHSAVELLRRQAIAAADDDRIGRGRTQARLLGAEECGNDVLEQGLAGSAELLGAVENRDRLDGRRKRRDEMIDRERAEQPDLDNADLLTGLDQRVDGLFNGLAARTHDDDDTLGVGGAIVIEKLVLTAGQRRELVHRLLHDLGAGEIERVARFGHLEESVGVLRGAADNRMVGRQAALAVGPDQVRIHHGAQILVGQLFDLADFVRGPETVEEVQDWNPRLQSRGLTDAGKVMGHLDRTGRQHRETGLAGSHDIGVVAEDRQRVGRDGTGGNMHTEARQLAGDLVHVRDFQKQALRRREGRRQRTALQSTVDGASGTGFGLHFDHAGDRSPNVFPTVGRPRIRVLAHIRRRRDRINGDYLICTVGNRSGGFVAIHRNHSPFRHGITPLGFDTSQSRLLVFLRAPFLLKTTK